MQPHATPSRPRSQVALLDAAAVLVLFAPDADPGPTLRIVLSSLEQVVLVDNTQGGHPAAKAWCDDARVAVVENANRGGLAGAYNTALGWLMVNSPGTRYVLFIDDDSDASVLDGFLRDPAVADTLSRLDTAAVAPAHRERATGLRARHMQLHRFSWTYLPREVRDLQRVAFIINSMSVWRMDALRRIGPYNEWLGVDHVDTEYCLRARRAGLAVYLNGDYEFAQSIGRRRAYRLLGKELQSGGHSASRRRSIGRATAWLSVRYLLREPAFAALGIARLTYEAVGIAMAEDQRAGKLMALLRGAFGGALRALIPAIAGRSTG